jgi:hypothetical protein
MKRQKAYKDAHKAVWNLLTMKIVDEPATERVNFHPHEKSDELLLGEMMGEKRADDDIDLIVGTY